MYDKIKAYFVDINMLIGERFMQTDYNNNQIYSNTDDEIDIIKLLKRLFTVKHIIVMVIAGVIAGSAAFAYSKFVLPELFISEVSLYVNSSTVRSDDRGYYPGYGVVDMTSLATSRNLADSYVIILSNDAAMEKIGDEMLKIYSPAELQQYFPVDERDGKKYIKGKYIKSCFRIEPVEETEILRVIVTTQDPQLSVHMCNAMTRVAPEYLPTIANGGAVEPIGSASIPDGKAYPNNRSNAVKGVLAGLFAVICLFAVRILMDTKIRDTESFKEKFDYPVLGEIPLINNGEDKKGIGGKSKQNGVNIDSFQVTEAFNALCNNLIVTMSMNDEKIIVVSSPEMSDGKSTVSLKLAKSMANMGNKVLLIDLDLRRPSIHKKLNIPNKSGFTNLLSKPEDFDKYVHKNIVNGLDVMLSGGVSPNPSEMLSSKRTKYILDSSKEKYDFIIIDSPPVNVVTDACIVSQMAAGIVVVVRANQTHFDDFSKTAENIEITRTRVAGVVINGVEEFVTKYGKGKYGYKKYGYKYSYGYAYSDNETEKNINK